MIKDIVILSAAKNLREIPHLRFGMTAVVCLFLAGCTPPPMKFESFECPHNSCATHKAGYDWAKKNKICAREWCNSKNPYFNEGCLAWVQEKPPLPDGNYAPLDFDPSRKARPAPIPPGDCKAKPGASGCPTKTNN